MVKSEWGKIPATGIFAQNQRDRSSHPAKIKNTASTMTGGILREKLKLWMSGGGEGSHHPPNSSISIWKCLIRSPPFPLGLQYHFLLNTIIARKGKSSVMNFDELKKGNFITAAMFTVLSLFIAHWFPWGWFVRLGKIARYVIGSTCILGGIIIYLSRETKQAIVPIATLFSVGGVSVVLSNGIDKLAPRVRKARNEKTLLG